MHGFVQNEPFLKHERLSVKSIAQEFETKSVTPARHWLFNVAGTGRDGNFVLGTSPGKAGKVFHARKWRKALRESTPSSSLKVLRGRL